MRGYDKELVTSGIQKARGISRSASLESKPRMNRDGVYLVLTFHPALSREIHRILRSNHNILACNAEHSRVFSSIPCVSFRHAQTLRDVLVRSKIPVPYPVENGCKGCGKPRCMVCNLMCEGGSFSNSRGELYQIRKGMYDCDSSYVIYLLTCKTCNKKYVGSTITGFRYRVNNYKSHFSAHCKGKRVPQAGLFDHFIQDDHHGLEDFSFQVIDRSGNHTNLLKRESFWQHRLSTFEPNGLNERAVSIPPLANMN